uniref:Uncharacterized protein n=1 Tax=Arundo donax TaxID=35708 RepID=A0A0A9BIA6_ARUDO
MTLIQLIHIVQKTQLKLPSFLYSRLKYTVLQK